MIIDSTIRPLALTSQTVAPISGPASSPTVPLILSPAFTGFFSSIDMGCAVARLAMSASTMMVILFFIGLSDFQCSIKTDRVAVHRAHTDCVFSSSLKPLPCSCVASLMQRYYFFLKPPNILPIFFIKIFKNSENLAPDSGEGFPRA